MSLWCHDVVIFGADSDMFCIRLGVRLIQLSGVVLACVAHKLGLIHLYPSATISDSQVNQKHRNNDNLLTQLLVKYNTNYCAKKVWQKTIPHHMLIPVIYHSLLYYYKCQTMSEKHHFENEWKCNISTFFILQNNCNCFCVGSLCVGSYGLG